MAQSAHFLTSFFFFCFKAHPKTNAATAGSGKVFDSFFFSMTSLPKGRTLWVRDVSWEGLAVPWQRGSECRRSGRGWKQAERLGMTWDHTLLIQGWQQNHPQW